MTQSWHSLPKVTCLVSLAFQSPFLPGLPCSSHDLFKWYPSVLYSVTALLNPWTSEVTQSCPTLCDPMDCSLPGSSVHGIFQQEYWSGLPFPSLGDHPNPGIEPGSPTLQTDALLSETSRLSNSELMLFNCGVGEGSWEPLGLQRDPTSQS